MKMCKRPCEDFIAASSRNGSAVCNMGVTGPAALWNTLALGLPGLVQQTTVQTPFNSLVHHSSDRNAHSFKIFLQNSMRRLWRFVRGRQVDRQFSSFLEAAPDAVVIVDNEGKIAQVNGQTEKIFGYERKDLIGQNVEILMPERFRVRHRAQLGSFGAHPTTRPMGAASELWGLRKNGGEFPVEISLSPIPNPENRGILIASIIRDVTDRRHMEQELRDADRHKDEFLATLAHELRNPLAPIRNAVHYLGMEGLRDSDVKTARDIIARQVSVMARLIDDLLDVSRISRNKLEIRKERVELATVLQAAVESSRPLIQQCGHDLTISIPTRPIFLDADSVRLSQVFLNLLNNAAKYTKHGGHIWLSAEREGSDAVVTVRDNGVGISNSMMPRIFEMFTQVDRSLEQSQGGLGVGLTLVRRLVEMHDGSVEVISNGLDKGSAFIVRLPLIIQPRQEIPPMADEPSAKILNGCRMLVVDDNKDSAESLGMLLRLKGNDIRTAYDGLDAFEVAQTFRPELVLLDIGLPKMNGYDVARRIRQESWGQDIILVALTGWAQEEDKRLSREAGFNFHLVKPVKISTLDELLGEIQATDN